MTPGQPQTLDPASLGRLEELLNRQDIRACLDRISRAIDRFDRELFLSGYHPDAIIDAGALVGSPGEVYEQGAILHERGQSSTLHYLLNHNCDIEGDTAHSETYFLYVGRNRDESNWTAGGRYIDRLERREGEWKIAFRYTVMEWSGRIPKTDVPLFDQVPDIHFNGAPSRNTEDPSYRRPLINRRKKKMPENIEKLSVPRN